MSPQTQQLFQNPGARVKVGESLSIAALSVSIVHLCSSPPRHCSGPCSQVQSEILSLAQTNWSGILTRSGSGLMSDDIDSPDVRESLICEVDRSLQGKKANIVVYLTKRQSIVEPGVGYSLCLGFESNRLRVILNIVFS